MFSKFSEEAKKVLLNMQKEMSSLKHPYIGSEHLLLSILKYGNKDDIDKLSEYNVSYNSFRDELIRVVGVGKQQNNYFLYTPLLRSILENATVLSMDKGKKEVDSTDLLLAIFDEGEGIAIRILLGMNIDVDDLYDEFDNIVNKAKNGKLSIDSFGYSLNEKYKNGEIDPVVGRDKEINRMIEILTRRTKNNPLLIGEAGVGKTAIVEELARRIEKREVPSNLIGKRIVSVSMSNLVAGTKYRGEFEERIEKLVSELENAPDVILFIDEIHTLVGAGGAEGAIDASNIFKPALARGKIKLIGATTIDEYKDKIANDKALARRFQNIEIKEVSSSITLEILKKLRPIYENYHKVKISDEVIDRIVFLSNKYIYNRKMPDKAIDILDEVCSRSFINDFGSNNIYEELNDELLSVKELKNKFIIDNDFTKASSYRKKELELETKINKLELKDLNTSFKEVLVSDVDKVICDVSKIPVLDSLKDKVMKNFKSFMKTKIVGQDTAIDDLYNITKKIRYNRKNKLKPTSFLFVGKTGVGKTLLAKEYCKYFYGEDSLIRLDMSEYKESHSISKIIGAPPGYVGYQDSKNVLEMVKDNPYSVILLDEIEKASIEVINLFLQILDEGVCKNSKGEEIRFDNTIIIMTSNIGCNKINIGFNDNRETLTFDSIKDFLGIEFVNRINKVIYFKDMDYNSIKCLVKNKLNDMKSFYSNEGISLNIPNGVIVDVINKSQYDKFGARRIDKIIEDEIEGFVIDQIIDGKTQVTL